MTLQRCAVAKELLSVRRAEDPQIFKAASQLINAVSWRLDMKSLLPHYFCVLKMKEQNTIIIQKRTCNNLMCFFLAFDLS